MLRNYLIKTEYKFIRKLSWKSQDGCRSNGKHLDINYMGLPRVRLGKLKQFKKKEEILDQPLYYIMSSTIKPHLLSFITKGPCERLEVGGQREHMELSDQPLELIPYCFPSETFGNTV